MSEPEKNRQHVDSAVEAGDETSSFESGMAVLPADHGDVELPDLSDTGVGLSFGEPNTFEPEEGVPGADSPMK
jgi:hypothetical protein